jgi:ribonuclease J
VHHAELAVSMGLSQKHVLICEDGDQIDVSEKGIRRAGKVPAGFHYIDGSAGDLDERPLEERRMLAEYGVLLISAGVDRASATIAQAVTVSARGWFEGSSDAELLVNLTSAVRNALQESLAEGILDADALSKVVQKAAGRLLGQRYRRQPVILPAIVVL